MPFTVTSRPLTVGVKTVSCGGCGVVESLIVTLIVAEPDKTLESVEVTLTRYVPVLAYVCADGNHPEVLDPSPQFQAMPVTVAPGSVGVVTPLIETQSPA